MEENKKNVTIQISVPEKEYWKLAMDKGTKRSWYEFLVKEKVE